MGCLPGSRKTEGCRIFESGLAAGSQLRQPQESGCRNLGLCFRNIPWKAAGASCKTGRIRSSYLRSAQCRGGGGGEKGGSGDGPGGGDPGGTVPCVSPQLRASRDRGSRSSPGVTSLPGGRGDPKGPHRPPAPGAAAEPLADPPFPCAHRSGAGCGEQHTASWVGFFFNFFFSSFFYFPPPPPHTHTFSSARRVLPVLLTGELGL